MWCTTFDAANRLVAAGLEADWNGRLAELATIEDELARFRADIQQQLSADMRKRIFALTSDLPLLWANPAVIDRERKEILALLIEDVTLLSEHTEITAHVRLRGCARRSHTLTRTSMQPRKRNPPDIRTRREGCARIPRSSKGYWCSWILENILSSLAS